MEVNSSLAIGRACESVGSLSLGRTCARVDFLTLGRAYEIICTLAFRRAWKRIGFTSMVIDLEVCASFFAFRWELMKKGLLACNVYKLCYNEV